MKMLVLAGLFLMRGAAIAQSANVGIGTTSPSSRLTVNGSVAAGYRSVTATAYTLTDADYVVVYNGASGCTLTLPTAISGTGNFAGRMYRVKNNARAALALQPAGSERISNAQYVFIDSGSTTEIISTGATGGTTWEVTNTNRYQAADNIRGALSAAGCASCPAYDAAATNAWVPITEAEYSRMAALPGVVAASAPNEDMSISGATSY